MRHAVAGRKLGRTSNQRKALFRTLANQLIINEKLVTTEAKAKAVRPFVEKLITTAKSNTIHARRLLLKDLVSENTVKKMLELIGPKFQNRPGGYTRLVKMSARMGDRASMVSLMFVEAPSKIETPKKAKEIKETTETKEEVVTAKEVKAPAIENKPRAARAKKKEKEQDEKSK